MHSEPITRFYADNEVVFVIEHPEDWRSGEQINGYALAAMLNPELGRKLVGVNFNNDTPAIRFTPPPPPPPAVAQAKVALQPAPGKTLSTILKLPLSNRRVKDCVNEVNEYLTNSANYANTQLGDGARLSRLLPNYFLSASSHESTGTHGPGRVVRPTLHTDDELVLMKIDTGLPEVTSDCGIDIYILDTVPEQTQISTAWNKWRNTTLQKFGAILARTNEFDPDAAHIYRTELASYFYATGLISGTNLDEFLIADHQHCLDNPNPDNHLVLHQMLQSPDPADSAAISTPTYIAHGKTSDHGLFIASLIHKILPYTPLYVIQVLNDYGIGTIWSLIAGFNKVAELHNGSGRRAMINCSFTLSIAPDDEIDGVDLLFTAMRQCVYAENVAIVAASGNDSVRGSNNTGRTNAGYPANLNFVLGVGALDKQGNPAKYSNTADNPAAQGYMAFGGDYTEVEFATDIYDYVGNVTNPFAGTGTGIVGVYTGDFVGNFIMKDECEEPIMVANQNGFAEWAGTSFATPIVCAMIVQEMCNPSPPKPTIETGKKGSVGKTAKTAGAGEASSTALAVTTTGEPDVDTAIIGLRDKTQSQSVTKEKRFVGVTQTFE